MKKILLALATVAALFATSCKNESINPANELKEGEFLATIDKNLPQNAPRVDDGMSQKTTISGFAIYWQADDEININGAAFKTNTTGSTVVFAPTDKSAPLPEGPYHAFYGAVQKTDDAQYNYATLPAQQTFNTGIQDERKIVSNIPLYAYSETKELTFHNVFAILKINIPTGVTASSIEISANEVMNGEFKVEEVNETYTAVMTESATAANTKITVVPQSGSFDAGSEVYVAIPANSYTGLAVKMTTTSETLVKHVGSLTLEADKLYNTNINFADEIFHFTALENNCTVRFSGSNLLKYSTNGTDWTDYTAYASISLQQGEKVYFKAKTSNTTFYTASYDYKKFTLSGGQMKVSGNIMYLLDPTGNQTTLSSANNNAFYGLFENCSTLVDAGNLILPAETLSDECYNGMFRSCSGLVNAPELPAETLAYQCYSCMFIYCTSLENAPALPAETLQSGCYALMFYGCTSLKNAPELPAKTATSTCYACMFYRCTSLENAPALPATTLANGCYHDMFFGCTSLENAPNLPAKTLTKECYYCMFHSCSRLKSVTMLATSIPENTCVQYWLSNAGTSATNPTLTVANSTMKTNTFITDYTPSNWTITYPDEQK